LMTNCTVVGNGLWGVTGVGGRIANCIIRDNAAGSIKSSPIVSCSNIEGAWAGAGNIDADPCFVEAGYWDSGGLWVDGDYHLRAGSLCVEAGDNGCVPSDAADLDGDGDTTEPVPCDLGGDLRMVDADSDGNCVVDMGAYEYFVPPIEVAMKFTPSAFNPGSEGRWAKLHFVLPEGYGVDSYGDGHACRYGRAGLLRHGYYQDNQQDAGPDSRPRILLAGRTVRRAGLVRGI
jgi:hypothetical protein